MKAFCRFLIVFACVFSSKLSAKTVLDVISENEDLTIFYSYLEKTDLKRVLEKKLPWNWTIFAPSNKAFKNASKSVFKDVSTKVLKQKN